MTLNAWRCELFWHIFSFLVSYDSGYTSLGDSKTIISCNNIKIKILTSLGKFDFLTILFTWWFVYWVQFSTVKYAAIDNAIFHKVFLRLKRYSAISVFLLSIRCIYFQVSAIYSLTHLTRFSYYFRWVSLSPRR